MNVDVLVVNVGSSSIDLSLVPATGRARAASVPTGDDIGPTLRDLAGGPDVVGAVGHRIVHGGSRLTAATVVDDEVRRDLEAVIPLAPVHLPPALRAVDEARRVLPEVPHVACFDTTFHRHLPPAARTYALPAAWRERWDLRRFGFHGLSYAWALRRSAELLGRDPEELQMVLLHLGGGSSVCAVRDGRSVDTSMGLTPLEGLVMTSRSGSVDPGLLLWLLMGGGLSTDEVADGLWRHSGLDGLAGRTHTNDLVAARRDGDDAASLALAVFTRSICQAVAAAATSLERLDAVVFTGEIGFDEAELRRDVCAGLGVLGLPSTLDVGNADDAILSQPAAAVPVAVVRPREDLEIARETRRVLG